MNVKKNRIEFSLTENEKDAVTRVLDLLEDMDGQLYIFQDNFGNLTVSGVGGVYEFAYDGKYTLTSTINFLDTLLKGNIYIDIKGNENETI